MVLAVRGLAIMAALLLAAISPSHAYKVRTGEVYEVPEADRVSAKQRFARDADLVSVGLPYIKLTITVPGRVYIRHVENETAVAAGLFGKLRASGDTRGAVEYVAFPVSYEFQSNARDEFAVIDSSHRHNTSKAESLLLDVELYHKNTLKKVTAQGSADVVILEDVVYAAQDGALMPEGTELNAHTVGTDNAHMAVPGRLFVSDPKARLSGSSLSVITAYGDGGNVVQLDVASLNSTQKALWVCAQSNSTVTLFASESVSPIFMVLATRGNETTPRSPLCVATKGDVDLTWTKVYKDTNKTSVISGGSTCVKLPLPPREPALIRDEIDSTSQYLNTAKTATPAPPLTASANQLVYSGIAAGLLVLSSMLLI